MANSRMYLTCRHCGAQHYLAKGYYGEYGTRFQDYEKEYVVKLNNFFDNHGGSCLKATHNSDNARDHYIITEELEQYNPETNEIEYRYWTGNEFIRKTTKLPEDY